MIPLTDEENKSYENQKRFYICKKYLLNIIKKYEIIVILQEHRKELLITSVI